MSLEQFKASRVGSKLAGLLTSSEAIERMERASMLDRPAVEAIGRDLEARVGALDDEQKKLVGRWVKELLTARGWKPDRKGRVSRGNFFARGTIYRRAGGAIPSDDGASRLRAARALVRRLPHAPISADELVAERRRAAWREA